MGRRQPSTIEKPTRWKRKDHCWWCNASTKHTLFQNPITTHLYEWVCDVCQKHIDHPAAPRPKKKQ